jgi:DNA mismatch repair protein MutS
MTFHSILFDKAQAETPNDAPLAAPDYFADLHLDDIVGSIMVGRETYRLAPFFYEPLRDASAVAYRHAVFRDLEDDDVAGAIRSFGRQMQEVRRQLVHSAKTTYVFDQERWLLSAADAFGAAVRELSDCLTPTQLRSDGLSAFRDYLAAYTASEGFTTLAADTQRLKTAIEGVTYRLRIHGPKVTVTRYRPEPDYSVEVLEMFERFRQAAANPPEWHFDQSSDMNHVEAAILERVARLSPDVFEALHGYAERHREFLDPTVERFDREVQFYVAYLEHTDRFRRAGLRFCYPQIGRDSDPVRGQGVFDLALAGTLVGEQTRLVPNDFELEGPERIIVVSGPNQGGKTTFARQIGQLHHLARIGVPVPGVEVQLPLVDQIFAHFERVERVEDLSSKLEDDLRRIQRILSQATRDSLLIMNESFSSTTVGDQLFIGLRILRAIIDRGLLCVVVTFLDELASLDPATVSMVSSIDPLEPTRRTFKIVRRPTDGLAYAMAIAEKHGLTYPSVRARLAK